MHETSQVAEIVAGTVMLLLIAATVLGITQRLRFPFTVALVLVGMGLSLLAAGFPSAMQPIREIEISPQLILFVFLPTLIFESTFNLNVRQLLYNIGPILTLAIPGLLISTLIIGSILSWTTPIPLVAALLLGAILSATDPVAVVALFKQIGAPERLTIMMEGESLFNDATSIVLATILMGVVAAGTVSSATVINGINDFFILFVGGLISGIVLAWITGHLLALVESNPFIEISLTTALAYLSFLVAEELLHVSGVMATVGAGLTLGGWGRTKISASVQDYLGYFWEHLAFIANALIFLLVGMTVNLTALLASLNILPWVILAMLVGRAAIIYALIPLVGQLPGSHPVERSYQTVMFWGGLRGAIALAIVLSLPASDTSELFVALVMGAVLFTLLVQGVTIAPLLHRLGLDTPPLPDRLAELEGRIESRHRAALQIPALRSGGLFSNRIASRLQQQCQQGIDEIKRQLVQLQATELNSDKQRLFLYLRSFAEERRLYTEMYSHGHLSEGAYRELVLILTLQIDALRHNGGFTHVHSHRLHRIMEQGLYRMFDQVQWLSRIAERFRLSRLIRNYEEVWGHYQGSGHILDYLDQHRELNATSAETIDAVRSHYQSWHELAKQQLEQITEQFPEFVISMQERLGDRLLLLTEAEIIEEQQQLGLLPKGVTEQRLHQIYTQLSSLRGQSIKRLAEDPVQLLKQVPLFAPLSNEHLQWLAQQLTTHTLDAKQPLIQQGEHGDAIYLLVRGVVRIARIDAGRETTLGTLIAGDFFGEMALMHHSARSASVTTITPCKLFRLQRQDLETLMQRYPAVQQMISRIDVSRSKSFRRDE